MCVLQLKASPPRVPNPPCPQGPKICRSLKPPESLTTPPPPPPPQSPPPAALPIPLPLTPPLQSPRVSQSQQRGARVVSPPLLTEQPPSSEVTSPTALRGARVVSPPLAHQPPSEVFSIPLAAYEDISSDSGSEDDIFAQYQHSAAGGAGADPGQTARRF